MNIDPRGQSEEKARLLEIYKIQVQAVNDLNNRIITTNRYFFLMITGLFCLLFGYIQDVGVISIKNASGEMELEELYRIIGGLGGYISIAWFVFIDFSHKILNGKYKALKKLEGKLDFQFITHEWEYLSVNSKNITYQDLYAEDFYIPFAAFMIFSTLFLVGVIQHENRLYLLFLILPIGWIIWFVFFYIRAVWRTRVK